MANSVHRRLTVDEVIGQLQTEGESDDDIIDEIGQNIDLDDIFKDAVVIEEQDIMQSAKDRELPIEWVGKRKECKQTFDEV